MLSPPLVSTTKSAILRLLSDYKSIQNEPPDGCSASPINDDNMVCLCVCACVRKCVHVGRRLPLYVFWVSVHEECVLVMIV